MTSLFESAARAQELGFNLTGPMAHADVVTLAGLWLPEIRFHEKERFHPVDLERFFKDPPTVMDGLPAAAQEPFLISVSGPAGEQKFFPPVVRNGNTVLLHGGDISRDFDATPDGTERLLTDVSGDTVYTHGASLDRSKQFFGATVTVTPDTPEPGPGNPRVPRHPIGIHAEMRFLLDALRHHLQEDKPQDALWGFFFVEDLVIKSPRGGGGPGVPDPRTIKLEILRELVAGFEAGDDARQAAAIQRITDQGPDWALNQRAWDAVRFYAFLEYQFVYAYNDYPDYGDWPFTNEHEGDVEGCCVVFDRRDLVGPSAKPIADVVAHTVITSVHEEFNDNDELKRLPVERDRARDDLVVYVAPGSHATYLTAGSHDVIDWEDILTDWPGQVGGWKEIAIALAFPAVFVILLIVALVEHFVDAEDQTSDDGARTGPPEVTAPGPTTFAATLNVAPLSAIEGGVNLYQAAFDPPLNGVDPAELARRAYPGKLGGHDGTADHSASFEDKTTRYFKKFLSNGEIVGQVIL